MPGMILCRNLFKPVDGFMSEAVSRCLFHPLLMLQDCRFFSRNFIICLKTPSRMSAEMK